MLNSKGDRAWYFSYPSWGILFVSSFVLTAPIVAQSSAEDHPWRFDVASVKPSEPGPAPGFPHQPPVRVGGTYSRIHITVKGCIQVAYKMAPYQVSGPAWIERERYDIAAKMPEATTDEQVLLMLQTLLRERFKLKVHREQKEESAYVLKVSDGGVKIRLTDGSTTEPTWHQLPRDAGVEFKKYDMRGFAATLMLFMRGEAKPIVDMTGLSGFYDFRLEFSAPPPHDAGAAADAVRRLGLKLESGKAPVDYLVVDHVEPATAN